MSKVFRVFLFVLLLSGSSFAADWTFYTDGCYPNTPAISKSGIIHATCGSYLYAINPDGSSKWTYLAAENLGLPIIGPSGTVYAVSGTRLYAVSTAGKLKWVFEAPVNIELPAVSAEDTIYFTSGGIIYSIAADGSENWSYPTSYALGSTAIGPDGTIYARGAGSDPVASVISDFRVSIKPDGTGFTKNGTQYPTTDPVIGRDGSLYTSLCCPWRNPGDFLFRTGFGTPGSGIKITSCAPDPVIGYDGSVYIWAHDGVAVHNPDLSWRHTVQASNRGRIAITSSGTIYTGGGTIGQDGTIYTPSDTALIAQTTDLGGVQEGWSTYRGNIQHTGAAFPGAVEFGTIAATIEPSGLSGAYWRVNDWGWRSSGKPVYGLPPGEYSVSFGDVAGYATPDNQTVTVVGGETVAIAGTYRVMSGSVKTVIKPDAVVGFGAKWNIAGGEWRDNGTKVDVAPGIYSVCFKGITNWIQPECKSVIVIDQKKIKVGGKYSKAGAVVINMYPAKVVLAGAMWSIDGGTWHRSGSPVPDVPVGYRKISFKPVAGWITPPDKTVHVKYVETRTWNKWYRRASQ